MPTWLGHVLSSSVWSNMDVDVNVWNDTQNPVETEPKLNRYSRRYSANVSLVNLVGRFTYVGCTLFWFLFREKGDSGIWCDSRLIKDNYKVKFRSFSVFSDHNIASLSDTRLLSSSHVLFRICKAIASYITSESKSDVLCVRMMFMRILETNFPQGWEQPLCWRCKHSQG